jgi:hypothetical protein
MKLYEVPSLFQALEAILIESGGELTPEIEAAWQLIEANSADKIEAAACVIKNLEADEKAAKDEAARLSARSASFANAADRLRSLVQPALEAMGGKVKTARFTIFTTTRESTAFALKPGHEAFELPEKFIRVREPELNKTALKDALKAGESLPDILIVDTNTSTSMTIR